MDPDEKATAASSMAPGRQLLGCLSRPRPDSVGSPFRPPRISSKSLHPTQILHSLPWRKATVSVWPPGNNQPGAMAEAETTFSRWCSSSSACSTSWCGCSSRSSTAAGTGPAAVGGARGGMGGRRRAAAPAPAAVPPPRRRVARPRRPGGNHRVAVCLLLPRRARRRPGPTFGAPPLAPRAVGARGGSLSQSSNSARHTAHLSGGPGIPATRAFTSPYTAVGNDSMSSLSRPRARRPPF
jgi:hypothetical protein